MEFSTKSRKKGTGESRRWLKNEFLKKNTECMMLAAQEQALRTNSVKFSIYKTSDTPLCRFCGINTETIRYITTGSS